MAKIITTTWTKRGLDGRTVKVRAFGYTLMVDGKRERKFSAEWLTRDDALGALEARRKAIAAGKVERAPERTLGQLAAEYLTYKKAKPSLREDTRYLTAQFLPAFGADLPVRRLTGPMIAQWERRRAALVSPYTINNELAVLKHMLRLAKKWGYLDTVPDIEMPKEPKGRDRYLSEDEVVRLLDACDRSDNPRLGALVRIAINTGMRRGELLGLEWERVNLSTSTITLYDTKGGDPRAVPINGAVYAVLIALEPEPARRTGPVFRTQHGGQWKHAKTAFTTALRRASIQGVRFHDLRHTAASHMVMRGRSLKEVQEVLGHKNFAMTLRYAHLSAASKLAAVEALDGLTPAPTAREMASRMAENAPDSAERRTESLHSAHFRDGAPQG
jgi:integrase